VGIEMKLSGLGRVGEDPPEEGGNEKKPREWGGTGIIYFCHVTLYNCVKALKAGSSSHHITSSSGYFSGD